MVGQGRRGAALVAQVVAILDEQRLVGGVDRVALESSHELRRLAPEHGPLDEHDRTNAGLGRHFYRRRAPKKS